MVRSEARVAEGEVRRAQDVKEGVGGRGRQIPAQSVTSVDFLNSYLNSRIIIVVKFSIP